MFCHNFIVLLSASVVYFCSAAVAQSPLPDFYWVGSGYDTTLTSTVYLPDAVAQPVIALGAFKNTPDNKWQIPNNTDVTPPTLECDCAAASATIQGTYQYQTESSTSVATSISFTDIWSSSESVDMSNTAADSTSFSVYIYDCHVVCGYYSLTLESYSSNVTDNFRSAVATLPTSFDPNTSSGTDFKDFQSFYSAFKANIITSVQMGGTITQRMKTESSSVAQMTQQGTDVQQQAQVNFEISIGESVSYSTSTATQQTFNETTTMEEIAFSGGDASSGNSCSTWSSTVPDYPAPLTVSIIPIQDYMTADYFPQDTSITDRSTAYSEYIDWYRSSNGLLYPLYPSFAESVETAEKSIQAYATCPEGTVILGGGCATSNMNVNTPWRMTVSMPVNNGEKYATEWACKNGEDYGSLIYNQDTFAYALCSPNMIGNVKGNVTIENYQIIESAPSNSSLAWLNSATATCPDNYMVTGGGCTTGDQDGDHPWLIHSSYPPTMNSWYCEAGTDEGSEVGYQTVSAFAVCVQYSSTMKYVPTVVTSSSIANVVSDSGQIYYNSCFAACPDGQILMSGGCDVENGTPDNPDQWRLTASKPQNNGWYCIAGVDYYLSTSYQTVSCHAICMGFAIRRSSLQ